MPAPDTTTGPAQNRRNTAHVVLDALGALERRIQRGYEPWRDYDGDEQDPKVTREGYLDLLESAQHAAITAVENEPNPTPEPRLDNTTQFARLLAAAKAAGAFTPEVMADLTASMDLPPERIGELTNRAQAAWEAAKLRHHTPTTAEHTARIAILTDGWIEVNGPAGHRYRLRLPTTAEIDDQCQDSDQCQLDLTAYHQH